MLLLDFFQYIKYHIHIELKMIQLMSSVVSVIIKLLRINVNLYKIYSVNTDNQ
jgi:hypothetical protein